MPNETAALLCHAFGQACSVVHTVGHALGYPSYELTAIARSVGVYDCRVQIEARVREYIERLYYWRAHTCDYSDWARFLR